MLRRLRFIFPHLGIMLFLLFVSISVSLAEQQSAALAATLGNPDEQAEDNTTDPIAFTGHGVLFDQQGNAINVTPAFVETAQKYYWQILYNQASAEQQARFDQKRQNLLAGRQWDKQSELIANAALIDWLIAEIKPVDAKVWSGRNNLLKQRLQVKLGQSEPSVQNLADEPFTPPQALSDLLAAEGLTNVTSPQATTGGGADYINECAAAGVPIPPTWGTSQWVSKGELTNEFISSGLVAEIYVYNSNTPAGLCIALPRSSGNTINLLGIICLGKATSNACFWDNSNVPKTTTVPLINFKGGDDLAGGDVCTDCHAGENPFVIHPNTNLGLPNLSGLDLFADSWYKPLAPPAWPQNNGPTNILDSVASTGQCTTCHTQTAGGGRFPILSTALSGYCGTILSQAFSRTMPPGSPGNAAYNPHVNALQAACNNPPGPPCNGTIFVDATYTGEEIGTAAKPFRTVGAAYNYACTGATLKIKAGSYPELINMSKNVTLMSEGGVATIGQ